MKAGYTGKILMVDLTQQKTETIELDREYIVNT